MRSRAYLCARALSYSLLILARLGVAWAESDPALPMESAEYAVKAAFLYNFAKFTEWPDSDSGAMTFCISGADPFGDAFAELETSGFQGRPVVIRRAPQDFRACRVLFINEPDARRRADLLLRVRNAPVLTVGDQTDFIDAGGMIGFVIEDDRVRFEANQEAAERAGLRLGSRMLDLARRVKRLP